MDKADVKAVLIGVVITVVSMTIYHRFLEPLLETK